MVKHKKLLIYCIILEVIYLIHLDVGYRLCLT
jgi:hypothetical protein